MATEIETTKKHILEKRIKIMKTLREEGYSDMEIGEIVGLERTWVFRLLKRKQIQS